MTLFLEFKLPHIFIMFVFLCSTANAENEIKWAKLDFPPWMILDGPYSDQGIFNKLLKTIIDELPEYKHHSSLMNHSRFDLQAKSHNHVCKAHYFKTPEREEFLYFSIPSAVFLANNIIMRRDKYIELGSPSSISLATLIKQKKFKVTLIERRSYGKEIDKIIEKNKNNSHIKFSVMKTDQLLSFISLNRTDYIIEFPAVRSFHEHSLETPSTLVNIPIDEALDFNISYVVCPKNKWGEQIIDRVNVILKNYVKTKQHRDVTLQWYDLENKKKLSKIYDNIFMHESIREY